MFVAIENIRQINLNPNYILDFKLASISILHELYMESKIRGWWFHVATKKSITTSTQIFGNGLKTTEADQNYFHFVLFVFVSKNNC